MMVVAGVMWLLNHITITNEGGGYWDDRFTELKTKN